MNKVCTKCKRKYPRSSEFFPRDKRKSDGLNSHCKVCRSLYQIYRMYNITPEEYNKLLIEANNHCMICGKHKKDALYKKLCIDHDHKTGRVRGLLCNRCNNMLGMAADNPLILLKGIEYLKRGKA